MIEIKFEDITFQETNTGIRIWYYDNYYFDVEEELGFEYEIKTKNLYVNNEKKAEKKLSIIINQGLKKLRNKLRNKETLLINEELGLPLIGSNEFGLIDRGTNIIEVKPVTGCNLNCVFCSISEGINNKKDLVVELNYLIQEFKRLASIKKKPIEANIGPQGEPLLYPRIIELVREIKKINNVETVSINTNGTLLNEELIDKLKEAGLTRINLSLHSLSTEQATKLANAYYDVEKIKRIIKYCEGKIDIMLTPLYIPSHNEDLEELFLFAKNIKNKNSPILGVQNYLNYKQGRNITQQAEWNTFYDYLRKKEQELKIPLMLKETDFQIDYDETLPKPFKKGQIIKATIITNARNKNEYYATAQERTITVINPKKINGVVSIKILRDKHNIYLAT
ncbi:radical SAM protein [Candidatus Woesearchaeota archaeon]|nr:radical SAM protein [Candidatus Woesearchaeota archaeon]